MRTPKPELKTCFLLAAACVDAVSKSEPLEGAAEDAGSSPDDVVEVEEEEEAWVWGLWHTASVEVRRI